MIRRFARPYARAIMDVTGTPQKAAELRAELDRFATAWRAADDLREVYANPGIEIPVKISITGAIAGKLGVSEMAIKVLEILIRNHRINQLDSILEALSSYVNTELGVEVADVRSAHALSAAEQTELQNMLEQKTGKKVEVRLSQDPALLGGFVARIGSEIFDASVSGKIHKFRESLS